MKSIELLLRAFRMHFSRVALAFILAPCWAMAQSDSSAVIDRDSSTKPDPSEMGAYSRVVALGGSGVTDSDGCIVELDLAFSVDAFGRRSRNLLNCAAALDELVSFPKLVSLTFPLSSLSDAGLQKIGELQALEVLRVVDQTYFPAPGPANISDVGVKHLEGLINLRVLQLQNAKLTDASMPTIGQLNGLTELSLRGNNITDAGFSELTELSLQVAHLATTQISGQGLSHLAHMPIETLGLSHCPLIDDDAMNELRRFSKLKTVWLSATHITDDGLSRITNLPLEYLAIGQTSVSDLASDSIDDFVQLRELHFHYTPTTDKFLVAVGHLPHLEHIVISTGCTPEGVAKLQKLKPTISIAGDWRHETWSNMVKIGQALSDFEREYGALPMTAPKNELGKPLYSWRVAILPLLGEQELFERFRLDEPWDSEHNIQLLNRIPRIYQNPNKKLQTKRGYTLLQAVIGESCLLHSDRAVQSSTAVDGTGETAIVIMTSAQAAVPWTAPLDYEVDLEQPKRGLSNDASLTYILFADGRASWFPRNTDGARFRAIYTRAGGD